MSDYPDEGLRQPEAQPAPSPGVEWVTVSPRQQLTGHWWLFLAYGALALVLGVLLASWPEKTITLVALLAGFQLVIYGCGQVFLAITPSSQPRAARGVEALIGTAAIVVGVLCFTAPLQTLKFTSFVLGAWLLLAGLADVALSLVSTRDEHRVWIVVRGMLGAVVGTILLVSPKSSLDLVVILVCAWLIGSGVVSLVTAFVLRRRGRQTTDDGTAAG